MKKSIIFSFIVGFCFVTLTASGCTSDFRANTSNASGSNEIKKETRDFGKFSGIGLSISADLILVQGTPQKVEFEGAAEDLEKIITEVRGNSLVIKKETGFSNLGKVKIYVTVENIESLAVSGSGHLTADGLIKTGHLDMAVSGSGEISLNDLEATILNSAVSGSGSIHLSGKSAKVSEHSMAVSGSGDIFAESLETAKVEVAVSGSGSCKIYATERIDASVSGSGDVYYKGTPVVKARVSGSGKVRSME